MPDSPICRIKSTLLLLIGMILKLADSYTERLLYMSPISYVELLLSILLFDDLMFNVNAFCVCQILFGSFYLSMTYSAFRSFFLSIYNKNFTARKTKLATGNPTSNSFNVNTSLILCYVPLHLHSFEVICRGWKVGLADRMMRSFY